MSLVPNIPRVTALPVPDAPPPKVKPKPEPAVRKRVLEPPYEIHDDLEPIIWASVWKKTLRYGWFNIGWAVQVYGIITAESPEGGVGLYRHDSPEATHYSQYHPKLEGGRL